MAIRRDVGKLLGTGLLFGLAVGSCIFLWWPAPASFENGFAEIRIGMNGNAALAILRGCDHTGYLAWGTQRDGGRWSNGCNPSRDLPPADQIADGKLSISSDNEDRGIEITLGPGGIVVDKQLLPGVWECRLERAGHALARAQAELMNGSWWKNQVQANGSLRRRSR